MTTVKELIEELQKYDQNSIVLYAYDENGDTGVHDFIDGSLFVVLDNKGLLETDSEGVVEIERDTDNNLLKGLELIKKSGGTLKPAIKLFCR